MELAPGREKPSTSATLVMVDAVPIVQQVPIHHRGGLLKCFAERERRHLHRETAGLPHAALYIVRAFPQMAVARIDVAPGVKDCDHGLPRIISLRTTH